MSDLENYLLMKRDWVHAKQIAEVFQLCDRDLRGKDSPIREFAISSDKGYRHIRCATEEEIEHFCNRLQKHGVEEIAHARLIRERRNQFVQAEFLL